MERPNNPFALRTTENIDSDELFLKLFSTEPMRKLQKQNDELTQAYELKMETNRQKTAFIQDMYHKIRTPLNVISGFSQLLTDDHEILPAEEIEDITNRMKNAADDISRLARELNETVRNQQIQ